VVFLLIRGKLSRGKYLSQFRDWSPSLYSGKKCPHRFGSLGCGILQVPEDITMPGIVAGNFQLPPEGWANTLTLEHTDTFLTEGR